MPRSIRFKLLFEIFISSLEKNLFALSILHYSVACFALGFSIFYPMLKRCEFVVSVTMHS